MPKPTQADADTDDAAGVERSPEPDNGLPGWVKIFGIVAIALIVLVVVLLLVGGGNHGPGRHVGGDAPAAFVTEGHASREGGHG